MLKIYGEPESPKEKACLRYKIDLANNIHTHDRMSGPSNSDTFEARPFKISKFQTVELETRRTFELSISTRTPQTLQSFELPNSRTFILSSLSNFDLGNIQTFEPETFRSLKPSISQTRDLSHKPQIKSQANLSNSKPSKVRTFELSSFRSFKV